MMENKEILQNLQEKKELLQKAQELNKLIAERVQTNNKAVMKRLQEERNAIVKAYMIKHQLSRNIRERFDKKGNEKPLPHFRKKTLLREAGILRKEYRVESYKIDTERCRKETEKMLESYKSDWNRKDYVSPEKKEEFNKSIVNLRKKAGMDEKKVDYMSVQKDLQKETVQEKPKQQER